MRRVSSTIALCVLLLCVLGHVSEMFDRWDHPLKTGRDIDFPVVVAALCAGTAVVLQSRRLRLFRNPRMVRRPLPLGVKETFEFVRVAPDPLNSSPPPLRI